MESQVSRTKTQKYTKKCTRKKPRKYKLPGLSVMNRYEKLLVRIKHVISIHRTCINLDHIILLNE